MFTDKHKTASNGSLFKGELRDSNRHKKRILNPEIDVTFKMQETSIHLKDRKVEVNFRMHLRCNYNKI